MKPKPLLAGTALILALLAVIGVIAGLKYREMHKPAPPPFIPPQSVELVQAKSESWQPTARLVGTVIAKRSIMLSNELAGNVTEVDFDTGSIVEPGQVLIKQDISTETADLEAAKAAEKLAVAAIDVANADIKVAQSDLDWAINNQKRFKEAGSGVSAAELDKAEADLRKAHADLDRGNSSLIKAQADRESAAARVQQIQTKIDKKTLKAPFKAQASIRTVHPGQYLAEGAQIVGLMEVTDDIYLDFAVPQEYAARVAPGMVVVASSEVLGSKDVRITVISLDSQVNPPTRNVRIRSTIADPQHKLKQGMAIDVEVPTELPREVVVIPSTAVRRAAFGDHVFVITPSDQPSPPGMPPGMVAHQRMIKLGPDLGGRVIVEEGLKAGEQIAAAGSFKLRDQAPVFPGAAPAHNDAPKSQVSAK
jgi:membrane fusion protein (multidrug efflux system)